MLTSDDLSLLKTRLNRDLTPLEYACFENLWSEHCSYRSTRPLLKTLPTEGENVLLGPGDDAAIVRFSEKTAIAIGMESHNHPSYVDPYDGAATGVGGIVRDILSMGARPIALMDPLYFGPLESEKNRYLVEHVVAGIGDYGNCIGVPVVRGETIFDESYSGNPLVNVICVGVVNPDSFITARVKKPGSRLFLFGSSTGRDGLGGASFASRDLSEDSEAEDRPAVQVGDPYTEKLLIEATLEMTATGKVLSCRDLGAAGLAGASSEMSSTFGARIHADRVHQREPDMGPVEIMLAESQERMLMEVAPGDLPLMAGIAEKYDLAWSDIGEVTEEPRYIIYFHGEVVCDLPISLLVNEAPVSAWEKKQYKPVKPYNTPSESPEELALAVLSHHEISSRSWVWEQYDKDVQLRTVSFRDDAAVLRLDGSALVLSCGCNPRHIHLDPYAGAANSVLENAANLACQGAEPLCIVNCLNFASPVHPEIAWQMEQAVLGMGDMANKLGVPVVGGNVSLYNESDEFDTQIKPTTSIGMAGRGELRIRERPSEGCGIAIVGDNRTWFGGSVLDDITACGGDAPPVGSVTPVSQVRELVRKDAVVAATDISHGGIFAALARFGTVECEIEGDDPLRAFFGEGYGRFIVAFEDESTLKGTDYRIIGEKGGDFLSLSCGRTSVSLSRATVEECLNSFNRCMLY